MRADSLGNEAPLAPGRSSRDGRSLAVIVGAGGLGMAVARRLGLSQRLIVADRNSVHVEQQCAALREQGYDANAVTCDVSRQSDVKHLAEAASRLGPVMALAYVVGLAPAAGDFRAILEVNLIGADAAARAFVDVLAPGGAAVFISSSAAHMRPVPDRVAALVDAPANEGMVRNLEALLGKDANAASAYMWSKAGLNRMCVRLAPDWGRRGLRIVSLSPGLIASPQGLQSYKHSPQKIKLFEATPLGRECTLIEIAGVADFLASDQASYINGVDILVDGGLVANMQKS